MTLLLNKMLDKKLPFKPTVEPRRWLRLAEAGVILGISAEAVRMMVRRGRLPYASIGRRIFIDRFDLDHALEASKIKLSCAGSTK